MEKIDFKKEPGIATLEFHLQQQIYDLLRQLKDKQSDSTTRDTHNLTSPLVAVFSGLSGSTKLSATHALASHTQQDIFRIDLSQVVSKYIGETEKNIQKIFDASTNKNWILFFDEADALFGKRTDVKDAHDKYANQEISYLLQHLEKLKGLVVFSVNRILDIPDEVKRRCDAIIQLPPEQPKADK